MINKSNVIKDLIKYLTNVYNGEKIEGLSQSFFISNKELDKILSEYFIYFKDKSELINAVKHNYSLIKDMSFPYEKGGYKFAKDLSIDNTVFYSDEQHMYYAHTIHSHLVTAFEAQLGVKEKREKDRITINEDKKVIKDILESLILEVEFLREDFTSEDFLRALISPTAKKIYLNIDNRSFHYLLSRIKVYFLNFTITAVAKTENFYSIKGTLLKANNLNNAKRDYPALKESIDAVLKKFA
ncbi:hypothetical protein N9C00_03660 [Flavobacteriales bacterium]|nr:hypothetical protein [Flavobacteriales bacterium]